MRAYQLVLPLLVTRSAKTIWDLNVPAGKDARLRWITIFVEYFV